MAYTTQKLLRTSAYLIMPTLLLVFEVHIFKSFCHKFINSITIRIFLAQQKHKYLIPGYQNTLQKIWLAFFYLSESFQKIQFAMRDPVIFLKLKYISRGGGRVKNLWGPSGSFCFFSIQVKSPLAILQSIKGTVFEQTPRGRTAIIFWHIIPGKTHQKL